MEAESRQAGSQGQHESRAHGRQRLTQWRQTQGTGWTEQKKNKKQWWGSTKSQQRRFHKVKNMQSNSRTRWNYLTEQWREHQAFRRRLISRCALSVAGENQPRPLPHTCPAGERTGRGGGGENTKTIQQNQIKHRIITIRTLKVRSSCVSVGVCFLLTPLTCAHYTDTITSLHSVP